MRCEVSKNGVLRGIIVMLLVAMSFLTGCVNSVVGLADGSVPPDFSVSVRVVNSQGIGDEQSMNWLRESGCYLLDADRSIHCLRGEQSENRTYPPVIGIVKPVEVEKVYRVVAGHNLMSEPTSVVADQAAENGKNISQVIYHVELTAGGRTCRYSTTAVESPSTVGLLRELIELVDRRIGADRKGL